MATKTTKSTDASKVKSEEFETDISKKRNWFVVLLLIIWWPFKIVLYPFIWVFKQFNKFVNFLVNKSSAPMDFEEIALIESTPVFFTLASVDLAIILGIIASIGFSDRVKNFINSLTSGLDGITGMVDAIKGVLEDILNGLYDVIVKVILGGTWDFITSIKLDPILLLILAIVFAIILVVIIMVISELDIIGRIMRKLGYFGLGIAELPYAIYDSLDHLWMRFLKSFGRGISGNMVTSKQRTFYRRIILFVALYAIWTFIWGVLILTNKILDPNFKADLQADPNLLYKQMSYFIIVILLSGFLAGTALMFVLSRVLKMVSRNRYNADSTEIDQIRHKSLVDYMTPKEHIPVCSLSDVTRLIDISKGDVASHFKDNALKDWVLTGNAIVNDKLYKERITYVEELVDKGLDEEDSKYLIKALDFLTFMQKGLRNVNEYVDDLEERKELINEDIADLRGLYGQSTTQEA